MRSRFLNENANKPDNLPYPRVTWPNDIMPDENSLSELSSEAQRAVVKTESGNPR